MAKVNETNSLKDACFSYVCIGFQKIAKILIRITKRNDFTFNDYSFYNARDFISNCD